MLKNICIIIIIISIITSNNNNNNKDHCTAVHINAYFSIVRSHN